MALSQPRGRIPSTRRGGCAHARRTGLRASPPPPPGRPTHRSVRRPGGGRRGAPQGPRSTSALRPPASTAHHPPAILQARGRRARGEGKRARSPSFLTAAATPTTPAVRRGRRRHRCSCSSLGRAAAGAGSIFTCRVPVSAQRRAGHVFLTARYFVAARATRRGTCRGVRAARRRRRRGEEAIICGVTGPSDDLGRCRPKVCGVGLAPGRK